MRGIGPTVVLERLFHDEQAARRARSFRRRPEAYRFADEDYLDHESWLRPAMAVLGDLRGRHVLDCGCGHGMAAVVMARRGAIVTAVDLSVGYVAETRQRAAANGVIVAAVAADIHTLPFAAASFDFIWGHAILHHLDLLPAAAELHRVLKPAGVAVFCEPWGENPLLELTRRYLPYPHKDRTPDERPLRRRQLQQLRRHFAEVHATGYQLLDICRRLGWKFKTLEVVDAWLLRRWPSLGRWCRYQVIVCKKGK